MELDVLIDWVLVVALTIAVLLLLLGKFVDLKVTKAELEETRAAINLLQTISTSSDLLIKDSVGQPIKLMFDKNMLDQYETKSSNEGIFYDEKCCNSIQYDYNLKLEDLTTGDKWSYDNLKFDLSSDCYSAAGLNQIFKVQMPANVCDGSKCDFGTSSIELARTPLSELAFWISETCLRKDSLIKTIPFDQGTINKIYVDTTKKEVCITLSNGEQSCKRFYCDTTIDVENEDNYWSPTIINGGRQITTSAKCFFAKVNRTEGVGAVSIEIPQAYRQ